MKYFIIPAAMLAALLSLSLWNAKAVERYVEPWCEALTEAVSAAEDEDWERARRAIRETREAWDARKPYLHIVTAHDELDKVDTLFAEADSFAVERDMGEFRAETAELTVQLRLIVEMQKLTVRNVL